MTVGSLPATTTVQEDITKHGQRRINLIWEATQAIVTISITAAAIYANVNGISADVLNFAFVAVISTYYARTNHQKIGGVLAGDEGPMTLARYIARQVLPAAYTLLPAELAAPEATVLLLAIGFQESKFVARRQYGGGPARGLWQFERGGGVEGVIVHPATRSLLAPVLLTLSYPVFAEACHTAIEHNDILAAVFARLLLWTDPGLLPPIGALGSSWGYYERVWRPGKPRPDDWPASYTSAVALMGAES